METLEVAIFLRRYITRRAKSFEQEKAWLVKGVRDLYDRLIKGKCWPGEELSKTAKGYPSTFDILDRLGVLKKSSQKRCASPSTTSFRGSENHGIYADFMSLISSSPSLLSKDPQGDPTIGAGSPNTHWGQEIDDSMTARGELEPWTSNGPITTESNHDNFLQSPIGTNSLIDSEQAAEPMFLDDNMPASPRFPELRPVFSMSQVEQVCIDAYFFNYHTKNPFLHEQTFKLQFYSQPQPGVENKPWCFLRNAVLAMGAWCGHGVNLDADVNYYQNAKDLFINFHSRDSGNITTVQVLLLLSDNAQKRGEINTAYDSLEQTVKVACSIGLHRDYKNGSTGPEEAPVCREIRKMLWWSIFKYDSSISMRTGRQPFLPDYNEMDINYPSNLDDLVRLRYRIAPEPLNTQYSKDMQA